LKITDIWLVTYTISTYLDCWNYWNQTGDRSECKWYIFLEGYRRYGYRGTACNRFSTLLIADIEKNDI